MNGGLNNSNAFGAFTFNFNLTKFHSPVSDLLILKIYIKVLTLSLKRIVLAFVCSSAFTAVTLIHWYIQMEQKVYKLPFEFHVFQGPTEKMVILFFLHIVKSNKTSQANLWATKLGTYKNSYFCDLHFQTTYTSWHFVNDP